LKNLLYNVGLLQNHQPLLNLFKNGNKDVDINAILPCKIAIQL